MLHAHSITVALVSLGLVVGLATPAMTSFSGLWGVVLHAAEHRACLGEISAAVPVQHARGIAETAVGLLGSEGITSSTFIEEGPPGATEPRAEIGGGHKGRNPGDR